MINLNETFYPIFHHLITQKSLTQNFLYDIYRSIQMIRHFNRWHSNNNHRKNQNNPNDETNPYTRQQLELYLFNLLQLNQPIEFYNMDLLLLSLNNNNNNINNLTMNYYQKSYLIGIGYCFNGILMAYVNNYTTNISSISSTASSSSQSSSSSSTTTTSDSFDSNSMKHNDICNQFQLNIQSFHNNHNDTIRFSDYNYGEFSLFWSPIQCESNSIIPIVLRYFIYTKEKSLFFEYDLRDYTIDQCALNINRCGATTRVS
ncbi:unnamed protein product [Schistosoma spindalis]|nr:unnamed protein product [Schistosoma spindale]